MARADFIAALLPRFCRRFFRSERATAPHLARGALGENLAANLLINRGCKVLARNFRGHRGGEIDLVCRDGETLVFVEVKTRSSEAFGSPSTAVDRKKRRRIVQGAMQWLRMLDMPDIQFRFDIVEVILHDEPEIRVIENAFGLPSGYYY